MHLILRYISPLAFLMWLSAIAFAASFGVVASVIALLSFQLLLLLEAHLLFNLLVMVLAVASGILLHGDLTTWISAPAHMMWDVYTAKHLPSLSVVWRWLGDVTLWKEHASVGICAGTLWVVIGQIRYRRKKNKVATKEKKLPLDEVAANAEGGSLIGMDAYKRSIVLSDKAANQHTLVLGTTGSGKTVTVCNIVESAINRSIPVIYIDGKGDDRLGKQVVAYAEKHDRTASLFSMHEEGINYNPLATGGFTSKKDRIIELREWSEEHYKKLSEGYLQAVFKVMECCHMPCNMVSLAAHLDLKQLKALVREHEASIPNAQKLMDELNQQEQASKSIESLIAEIRNFSASEIGHLFDVSEEKPVLSLDDVLEQKGVAYFSLPALEFPSMAKTLGRLIINDLKATVAKRWSKGLLTPVYVIFDEFSVFAGEQVLNVINMGRGAGIHAVLCTQSLSDIASARNNNASHFVNQVVGNCNNFILHRQNSPQDAEMLAGVIGTRNTQEFTMQVKENEPTTMGTIKQTKGFIIHPDEIKRLGTGEAFYISKMSEDIRKINVRKGQI